MKFTFEEYLAVLQSDDKELLDKTINEQAERRYLKRFYGIYKDYNEPDKKSEREQREKLNNIKPRQYEENRIYQMMQLYSAYREINHRLMWIEPRETSQDAVRRVVGKKPGTVYNTDILYLDSDTIETVQLVAEFSKNHLEMRGTSGWNLKSIVDELLACREIMERESEGSIDKKMITMRKLVFETDALKRAIGKQLGRNVFGIDDFSVNAESIISRKTNLLKKAFYSIKKAIQDESSNTLGKQIIGEDRKVRDV